MDIEELIQSLEDVKSLGIETFNISNVLKELRVFKQQLSKLEKENKALHKAKEIISKLEQLTFKENCSLE